MLASGFICFTLVALWLFCIFYPIVNETIGYLKRRKERKRKKKLDEIHRRIEIQEGCNALWVTVFEQKRAEKGELWACEHLESYGLIER